MKENIVDKCYTYNFGAFFYVDKFCKEDIEQASNNASERFNELDRKKFKSITVKVNKNKKCLDVTLVSEIKIERKNWLRATQYYCKLLAKEEGMQQYLYGKRLLSSF